MRTFRIVDVWRTREGSAVREHPRYATLSADGLFRAASASSRCSKPPRRSLASSPVPDQQGRLQPASRRRSRARRAPAIHSRASARAECRLNTDTSRQDAPYASASLAVRAFFLARGGSEYRRLAGAVAASCRNARPHDMPIASLWSPSARSAICAGTLVARAPVFALTKVNSCLRVSRANRWGCKEAPCASG